MGILSDNCVGEI